MKPQAISLLDISMLCMQYKECLIVPLISQVYIMLILNSTYTLVLGDIKFSWKRLLHKSFNYCNIAYENLKPQLCGLKDLNHIMVTENGLQTIKFW